MSTKTVILITGASTGFGRIAAELLGRRGYTVFAAMRDISGRNAAHREALESLARREGLALHVLEMDVTHDDSVDSGVRQILDRAGRIDVAINNAGVGAVGVTEAYTVGQFQQLFDVNLFGVVRVNRAVLPAMRRQRSGLLIHVSSGAGRIAIPCMAAYCASKFALEALADAYRFELSPFGIDSVVVEPGVHKTPILEKFIAPADRARVADYGPAAAYAERIQGRFDAANAAPETPAPEVVAQAFVDLMEMPAGERPFRVVPTAGLKPVLESYNAMASEMRQVTAQRYDVPELLVLRRSDSTND
jgi:NAD(P)-dependent dehydrogenase (short-subunit alcohol dehydrogenase family)